MPRNGSGTYAAPANSFNPAVTGNTASPTDWNSTLADISSALTSSIAKDGQTVITANLPMAGYKHTNVGAAVNRTDYARYDQLQDASVNWVDGGGTADAITATYNPAIATLIDGQLFFVRATAANATTTPTFSPNGLPPRTIVKTGGAALSAGDIAGDGHELILRYDLANTRYELLNPSDADAARKSVNNTFTGTNTFSGTTNIPDGTVSTYEKIASSVFASLADWAAGTASKILTAVNFLPALSAAIGFSKFYDSGQLTIATGGMSQSHGLGATPKDFAAYIVCTTTDLGYAVGDTIRLQAITDTGTLTNYYGGFVWVSSTQIGCTISTAGIAIYNKSTGAYNTIIGTSWRIIFRAWA